VNGDSLKSWEDLEEWLLHGKHGKTELRLRVAKRARAPGDSPPRGHDPATSAGRRGVSALPGAHRAGRAGQTGLPRRVESGDVILKVNGERSIRGRGCPAGFGKSPGRELALTVLRATAS